MTGDERAEALAEAIEAALSIHLSDALEWDWNEDVGVPSVKDVLADPIATLVPKLTAAVVAALDAQPGDAEVAGGLWSTSLAQEAASARAAVPGSRRGAGAGRGSRVVGAPALIPIPDVSCANCGAGLAWRVGVGRYVVSHDSGDDACSRATARLADGDREAASLAYRRADEAFEREVRAAADTGGERGAGG